MDVTCQVCQSCGASVPADNAFCTECGAVMSSGAPRPRRDDFSQQLAATISGQMPRPEAFDEPKRPASSGGAAAVSGRAGVGKTPGAAGAKTTGSGGARRASTPAPDKAASRGSNTTLYFVIGLAAVLALGSLLVYLIGIILRG